MKLFAVSMSSLLLRYYLMMLVVIVGVLLQSYFVILLSLPVFLSCLLGVSVDFFPRKTGKSEEVTQGRKMSMDTSQDAEAA
jgi:hypothetical protein